MAVIKFLVALAAAAALVGHGLAKVHLENAEELCQFNPNQLTDQFDRVIACLNSIPFNRYTTWVLLLIGWKRMSGYT